MRRFLATTSMVLISSIGIAQNNKKPVEKAPPKSPVEILLVKGTPTADGLRHGYVGEGASSGPINQNVLTKDGRLDSIRIDPGKGKGQVCILTDGNLAIFNGGLVIRIKEGLVAYMRNDRGPCTVNREDAIKAFPEWQRQHQKPEQHSK